MELQKTDLPEKGLRQSLIVAITPTGNIDISKVDKLKINLELKKFKHTNGSINYGEIFLIPKDQRIAAMAVINMAQTIQTITVALTICFETMNLSRAMSAFQILDLAEAIVDEAESDNLSLEDLMLFLQKLTRGEYPGLYEGMDIPKFMERFGQYRDERWSAGIKIRDEKVLEHKQLGDVERTGTKQTALDEHLSSFTTKLSNMKDELHEQKNENKRLRNQRDF